MSTFDVPAYKTMPKDDRDRLMAWLTDVIGEDAEKALIFEVVLADGTIDVGRFTPDEQGKPHFEPGARDIATHRQVFPFSTPPPFWPGLSQPPGFSTQ